MPKPQSRDGYEFGQVEVVRATCLYVATKLGDLIEDIVIIGGLVPSLVVDQTSLPEGAEAHVGTLDLDVGLTAALLKEERYTELTERLRAAGFEPDTNEKGNPTRQRWRLKGGVKVTIDFLIPPTLDTDRGGRIRHIESDFAAVIAPGLELAFRDRQLIEIDGETILGEKAKRSVWVAGAGAYVVLKALAFKSRGENKDAYDLFYVVRNYGAGPQAVFARLRPLLGEPDAEAAIQVLRDDFTDRDSVGPVRVANFLTGGPDDAIQADVVAFVQDLLRRIDAEEPSPADSAAD